MSSTLAQKTNHEGFPKPGELIEITGANALEASDRAVVSLLYQRAHDSGRLAEPGAEWAIPLADLRLAVSHKGNERVRDSLARLMQIGVVVHYIDQGGEQRTLLTHLFEFFDLPGVEYATATVRFGLPPKLRPILANSSRWGRIKAEVICAMSSRYSMALYELVRLRAHLKTCVEVFPIERFRDLLGVPPDAYLKANDFTRFVIEQARREVNALSDVHVTVEVQRRSPRAPIEAVCVAWSPKRGDEFRAVLKERARPKAGRSTRLRSAETSQSLPKPTQGIAAPGAGIL